MIVVQYNSSIVLRPRDLSCCVCWCCLHFPLLGSCIHEPRYKGWKQKSLHIFCEGFCAHSDHSEPRLRRGFEPCFKQKSLHISVKASVPRTGFEPAHLAALPPEDSASTNFATWAVSKGDAKIRGNEFISTLL